MTDADEVRSERRGNIAVWTLSRPERMNALSRGAVGRFAELTQEARADGSLRAVIITGAGDKAFCAGADLKERVSMTEEDVKKFLGLYRRAFGELDRLPVPVIAAINGVAFGGGLEIALACDFRVIARGATIGLVETNLGIIPGAGGTQRLTRIVGAARAKELILFARKLSADEALALGVVNRIADAGQSALDCAIAFAEPLTRGAPIALAAALEAIDAAGEGTLDQGLDVEQRCYERTLASKDRLEALAAFREKRAPVFRGE